VLRPPIEVRKNNGDRIIAKHKGDEFKETATPRKVMDPEKLKVLTAAQDVANEWVTEMRLAHVLDKLGDIGIEDMKTVILAMLEDVEREGAGEIEFSSAVRKAIGGATAKLFKARLQNQLRDGTTDA